MKNEELEKVYKECIEYANKIKNPVLREVSNRIYNDYKEAIMNKPATPGSHHFYKGGLLYHLYSVTKNAIKTIEIQLILVPPKIIFTTILNENNNVSNKYYFTFLRHIF